MIPSSVHRAAILFASGVFLAFLLPSLSQDGMFMDGELYAAVAHNEAHGSGTFWEPRFSQVGLAGLSNFHEHPPLVFGMQAAWFKVFGSAFWVERSYALLMAVITAGLLVLLWRQLVPKGAAASFGWWPVLLWIIVPTVYWCFHNNMHENTMGVFTTAAVLCSLLAFRGSWWWVAAAAILVFLASMAKGLPGLFPLAAPALLWLAMREGNPSRALALSVVMTVGVVFLYALLMLLPDAKASLHTYVESRLLYRIAENPTVDHRLATLEMLVTNMAGPLVVAALLIGLQWKKRKQLNTSNAAALAMAYIGLSGVAPLMLTMVQKSFYMAAALPIVALSIALWSGTALASWLATWSPKGKAVLTLKVIGIATIVVTFGISIVRFGEVRRDRELLADVHRIGEVVPAQALVGLQPELWNDWGLQTYLMRYHFISLDAQTPDLPWYITAKDGMPPTTASYLPSGVVLKGFTLWTLRTEHNVEVSDQRH